MFKRFILLTFLIFFSLLTGYCSSERKIGSGKKEKPSDDKVEVKTSEESKTYSQSPLVKAVVQDLKTFLTENYSAGSTSKTLSLNEFQLSSIISKTETHLSTSNLNESNTMTIVIKGVLTGAESSIPKLDLGKVENTTTLLTGLVTSLQESALKNKDLSDKKADVTTSTFMTNVMNTMAETVIGELDSAGLTAEQCKTVSKKMLQTMIGNAGKIYTSASEIKTALPTIMQGAVKGIDQIKVTGYDVNDLPEMIKGIASGATGGLAKLKIDDLKSEDVSGMVTEIVKGISDSLKEIEMSGYNKDQANSLYSDIQNGINEGVTEINVEGFDPTSIPTVEQMLDDTPPPPSENHPPLVGNNETFTAIEDTALNFELTKKATDKEGDTLNYIMVTGPDKGTLTNCMDQTGSDNGQDLTCTYTPNANVTGSDNFTYKVNDGKIDSKSTGTISFNITAVNDAPTVGANETKSTIKDLAIDFTITNAGSDIENDTLSYVLVTAPTNGTLTNCLGQTGAANGQDVTCTYTPNNAYIGSDTIIYKVNDGNLDSPTNATITVTVATPPPMVTIWRTTSDSESITLPLRSGYSYNFTVDWGDGESNTITAFDDAAITHTYDTAGDYTVTITGLAEAWYFNNGGSKSKIIEVTDLGALGWTDLSNSFYGCDNLTSFAGGYTHNVTSFNRMFMETSSLTNIDLSSFDTSSANSLGWMFYGASAISTLDLSSFNTTNVTSLERLFYNATSLTSVNLSSFDTSNVNTMSGMFLSTTSLTSLDVSHFDTAKVTNFGGMFSGATELTSLDLSNFNTSSATTFESMFRNMYKLESLDISNFNTSNVTIMSGMFSSCSSLTSLDLSHFNTAKVTAMNAMFSSASALVSLDISSFNTAEVTSMGHMFKGMNSLTTLDVSHFDTTKVNSMDSMFMQLMEVTTLVLSNFNTSTVTNMENLFNGTTKLTSLNVMGWDIDPEPSNTGIWTNANGGIVVYCDQGGSAGTGTFFTKTCVAPP